MMKYITLHVQLRLEVINCIYDIRQPTSSLCWYYLDTLEHCDKTSVLQLFFFQSADTILLRLVADVAPLSLFASCFR